MQSWSEKLLGLQLLGTVCTYICTELIFPSLKPQLSVGVVIAVISTMTILYAMECVFINGLYLVEKRNINE